MDYFESLLRERAEGGGRYGGLNASTKSLAKMIINKHGENVLDHYYITGIIGNPYDSKARLAVHKVLASREQSRRCPRLALLIYMSTLRSSA